MSTYERKELVRSGRVSDVYRGRRPENSVPIAVRVFEDQVDHEYARRFARQAQILSANVRHSGIVKVYEIVEEGQHLILLTELLEGETLRERLQRGPLPQAEAIEFARMVLSTLSAAHQAGYVHRDLRPEHVFVQGLWNIKVTDFGVMCSAPGGSGVAADIPQYMSPEQNEGRMSGRASDIYAVGVMLYEMLTGTVPFEGETSVEVLRQQKTSKPPGLPHGTPGYVKSAVTKALAIRPEDRFSSAEAFLRTLKVIPVRERGSDQKVLGRASKTLPPKLPTSVARKASSGIPTEEVEVGGSGVGSNSRPNPVRAHLAVWMICLVCLFGIGIALNPNRDRPDRTTTIETGTNIWLPSDEVQPAREPPRRIGKEFIAVKEPPQPNVIPVEKAKSPGKPDQERKPTEQDGEAKTGDSSEDTPAFPIFYRKAVQRVPIPFGTVTTRTASLMVGETEIKRQGRIGEKVITWEIVTLDGKQVSKRNLGEKIARQPVARLILEGTGPADPSLPPPPRPPERPKRPVSPTPEQQQRFESEIRGYGVTLQRWRAALEGWQNATGIQVGGSDPMDRWRRADREWRRRSGQR